MDCPICQTKGLSEGTQICPQCDSDLKSLHQIDQAEKAFVTQKKQKTLWILLTLFMAIAFISALYLYTTNGDSASETEYAELNQQLQTAQASIQQTNQENKSLQQELDALKKAEAEVKCEEINYTVQWGENLFSIASAVYGNGYEYPKIVEANSLDNPNHILDGQQLVIPF
ncbi:LysM peptidoglycan-binding domain-containing protein [Sunxiuqinia indica]|uniref:LysM peptidoglycan-binding domain-containing protein n=1 Tax=Sunxiuqinia indica TaxID=2692584 RepID=UPI0013593533|nr:LysM peptidoglycan-binding domain-containing protein [Sunxiuqinia indica]